jgi:hypothetical protein
MDKKEPSMSYIKTLRPVKEYFWENLKANDYLVVKDVNVKSTFSYA